MKEGVTMDEILEKIAHFKEQFEIEKQQIS